MRGLSFKYAVPCLDVHIRTETYEYKWALVALVERVKLVMTINTKVDRSLSGVHCPSTSLIFDPLI